MALLMSGCSAFCPKPDIKYIDKSVYINTDLSTNGSGTIASPFNNLGDSIEYAETIGANKLVVFSDLILDRNLKNYTIFH